VNPEIERYLDEHGATYTPEALRKGLMDAGYDPAEVDAALQVWQTERTGSEPDAEGRRTFQRWALGLHGAALVAVFVLLVALKGTNAIGLALLGCAVLAVAMLIGWAISSLIGRALLPGGGVIVALSVPAISALLLAGTCFSLIYTSIGTPPRDGRVQLQIFAPRAFDGSGTALCYVNPGFAGIEVSSQSVGTFDGKTVIVYVSWYGNDPNTPAPASSTSVTINFDAFAEGQLPESFGVIFSSVLEVDAAQDALSGTIGFEGLAMEPTGEPGQPSAPETISGTISWTCE
jgi:hypothetical protein